MKRSLEDRFWEKVDKNGPIMLGMTTPCWMWVGGKDKDGYGHIWNEGSLHRAPRVAFMLQVGPIPHEEQTLHRCDNRPCVRGDHLFTGTHWNNMHDKVVKQRQARGETSGRTQFTEVFVLQLREEHKNGSTQKALCEKYNLLSGTVHRLLKGTRWKHLAGL